VRDTGTMSDSHAIDAVQYSSNASKMQTAQGIDRTTLCYWWEMT